MAVGVALERLEASWGVARYQDAVTHTGGTYVPLTDFDVQCTPCADDTVWAGLAG